MKRIDVEMLRNNILSGYDFENKNDVYIDDVMIAMQDLENDLIDVERFEEIVTKAYNEYAFKCWYDEFLENNGCNAWYGLKELLKSDLEFKEYGKQELIKECLEIMIEFLQDDCIEEVKIMIKQLIEILESKEV